MTAAPLNDQTIALGSLGIGGGLLLTLVPGPFAAKNESFVAIGSNRTNVEPTRWGIWCTRIFGIVVTIIGGWCLLQYYRIMPPELS